MRIDYTLTPRARISAGRGGQVQNVRTIHQVIPGSVVRGALGAAWWGPTEARFQPASQGAFDELFTTLMDVHAAVPRRTVDDTAAFEPFSWAKCKYRSSEGCDARWQDQAVTIVKKSEEWLRTCPGCGQPVEHPKQGWRVDPEWSVATVRTALTNGLEKKPTTGAKLADGVAKDDMLFTRRAMVSSVCYSGSLHLASEPSDEVMEWLLTSKLLRVGGQRSTMGACQWEAVVSAEPLPEVNGYCAVNLLSPAILIDEFGAPSMDLAGQIQLVLGNAPGTVVKVWTRPEVISGWHGIAGLPKPSEWAVSAGSVALIEGATAQTVELLAAGIGVRRAEGYGQLQFRSISPDDSVAVGAGNIASEATVVGEEPEEEQQAASPLDALTQLVPEGLRDQTFRAVLGEAQRIKQLRDGGFPDHIITQRIAGLVSRPWMRDLSGGGQDAVSELLASPSLGEVQSALTVAIDKKEAR